MRRSLLTPLAAALVVTTIGRPVAAQTRPAVATTAPTLATLQANERDTTLKQLAGIPVLPPAPLAVVAQLGRDGEHLRVTTGLLPTAGQCRITVPGLTGLCTVNDTVLRRRGAAVPPPTAMPDGFLFDWYQFDQPDTTVACTTIEVLPANVQLSRSTETPDGGGSQVQLIEQRNGPTPGGDPGVRLRVIDQGGNGRPAAPDVSCSADSFADLCRLHPTEVARHLEPILRDLHADMSVLTPDPALAYQVFAADVRVDDRTTSIVKRLVAQLDADDFRDRDSAGEQLRSLGPTAAVAVGRIDVAKLSPEQRARTSDLLRQFRPVTDADAAALRDNVDFLLNGLRDPDPFVSRTALARLRVVVGHDVAFDASLRGRPRWDAVWQLRAKLTRG